MVRIAFLPATTNPHQLIKYESITVLTKTSYLFFMEGPTLKSSFTHCPIYPMRAYIPLLIRCKQSVRARPEHSALGFFLATRATTCFYGRKLTHQLKRVRVNARAQANASNTFASLPSKNKYLVVYSNSAVTISGGAWKLFNLQ